MCALTHFVDDHGNHCASTRGVEVVCLELLGRFVAVVWTSGEVTALGEVSHPNEAFAKVAHALTPYERAPLTPDAEALRISRRDARWDRPGHAHHMATAAMYRADIPYWPEQRDSLRALTLGALANARAARPHLPR